MISSGIGISVANEVLFGSTTHSIWAFINQFQLYLVIPFFKSYLTITFIGILSNFSIAFYNFSFLSGLKIIYFDSSANEMDYPQEDERFNESGITSGSFAINELNYFKSFMIIFSINILFIIFKVIWNWFWKDKMEKVFKFLSEFFHFKTYIRMVLEGYIFWLLWSLSENYTLYNVKDNTASYIISIVASLVALSWIPFIIISFVYCKESKYLLELFEVTKPSKIKKLYNLFFILRRTLMVFVIIFMKDLPAQLKLIINLLIQLLALGYSWIIRPLSKINDWLIDIVNDAFYLVAWVIVWFIEEESTRGESLNTVLIVILLVNQSIVWIINLVFLIIQLIKKWTKWQRDKKTKAGNKVQPITTETSHGNVLVLRVSNSKMNERSRELGKNDLINSSFTCLF